MEQVKCGSVTGGLAGALLNMTESSAAGQAAGGRVNTRMLGETGLRVSEIGFGGHSWYYKRVPDGKGGYRRISIDEATDDNPCRFGYGSQFLRLLYAPGGVLRAR